VRWIIALVAVAAAEASEERFRRFMENSPAAVFVKDAGFDYHLTKPVDPGALNDLLVEVAK
jgi:PAS domain-containing protein